MAFVKPEKPHEIHIRAAVSFLINLPHSLIQCLFSSWSRLPKQACVDSGTRLRTTAPSSS